MTDADIDGLLSSYRKPNAVSLTSTAAAHGDMMRLVSEIEIQRELANQRLQTANRLTELSERLRDEFARLRAGLEVIRDKTDIHGYGPRLADGILNGADLRNPVTIGEVLMRTWKPPCSPTP